MIMRKILVGIAVALLTFSAAWAGEKAAPDKTGNESVSAELDSVSLKPGEFSSTSGRRKVPLKILDAVRLGLTRNVETKKELLNRATQLTDLSLAERIFEPEFYLKGGYAYEAAGNTDDRGLGLEVRKKLITAGSLSFNWDQSNILDRETNSDVYQATLGVKLTQPLLRGAGVTVGTAEVITAQNTEASNKQYFRQHLMSQITSIQEAYWNLLLALENRISSVRSLQASRDVLERNKALIRAGRKAPADLVSAEQEVARNQVEVLNQEFSVTAANRTLVNLLDLDDNVAILPVEGFVFNRVEPKYQTLVDMAMKMNPSVLQAEITLKQRELDLKLARSNALDQLDLEVGTSRTAQADSLGESLETASNLGQGWTGAINLNIPLGLPRDKLKHQVTIAARELEKSKLDRHQTRLQVRQQVRDSVNDVQRSLRQVKLAELSTKLARQKYDIERTRLELGRSTNFQVLSYQRDLTSARDQQHQAIATYLKSLARLEAVVGTSLQTWNVRVEEPLPPKLPTLNLSGITSPPRLKGE